MNPIELNTPQGPMRVAPNLLNDDVMNLVQQYQSPQTQAPVSAPPAASAQPITPAYQSNVNMLQNLPTNQEIALTERLLQEERAKSAYFGSVAAEQRALTDYNRQKAQILGSYESQMQAEEAALENDRKTKQAALDAAIETRRAKKIEPWANKSIGAKIGAAIAMSLGAVGSAITGQRNTALDIIMKGIDDDVALQERELEREDKNIATMRQDILNLDNVFADKQQRSLAHKLVKLDAVKARFEDTLARVQEPQVRAKAAAALQQLAIEEEKTKLDLEQKRFNLAKAAFDITTGTPGQTPFGRVKPGVDPKQATQDLSSINILGENIDKLESISRDLSGALVGPGDKEASLEFIRSQIARQMPGGQDQKGLARNLQYLPSVDELLSPQNKDAISRLKSVKDIYVTVPRQQALQLFEQINPEVEQITAPKRLVLDPVTAKRQAEETLRNRRLQEINQVAD